MLAWVLGLDRLKNARLWLGIIEGNRSWVLHGFWVFVLISELKGRNPSGCLLLGNGFGYGSLLVIRLSLAVAMGIYLSGCLWFGGYGNFVEIFGFVVCQ